MVAHQLCRTYDSLIVYTTRLTCRQWPISIQSLPLHSIKKFYCNMQLFVKRTKVFTGSKEIRGKSTSMNELLWITWAMKIPGGFIEKILIYSTPTRLIDIVYHENSNGPWNLETSMDWTVWWDNRSDAAAFFFETSHAAGFGFSSGETRDFSHGRCLCGKQLS